MSKQVLRRRDFIRHLHEEAGLPYLQAERVCTVWLRVMENAMAAKSDINLGRIGVMRPIDLKPRKVVMGFKRSGGAGGGTMQKVKQEIWLGQRTRYVFKLNRTFGASHELVP